MSAGGGSQKGLDEALTSRSRTIYPTELERMSRVLERALRQLQIPKGSPELQDMATHLVSLAGLKLSEDELVGIIVAGWRGKGEVQSLH